MTGQLTKEIFADDCRRGERACVAPVSSPLLGHWAARRNHSGQSPTPGRSTLPRCSFVDPTNSTVGLDRREAALPSPPRKTAKKTKAQRAEEPSHPRMMLCRLRYLKAVDVLFDGKESELKLNKIEIVDGRTVRAEWTLSGVLKFPWRPRIQPFEGGHEDAPLPLNISNCLGRDV